MLSMSDATRAPNPGYRAARGVAPRPPGSPRPEEAIRRLRDGQPAAEISMAVSVWYEGVPPVEVRKNRGSTGWRDRSQATRSMRADYALLWPSEAARVLDVEWPWTAVAVEVAQFYRGKGLDADGLATAMAPILDAAVDTGIIPNDGPLYVKRYTIEAVHVRDAGQVGVRMTIRRLDSLEAVR